MNRIEIMQDGEPKGSINVNDTDWALLHHIDYIDVDSSGHVSEYCIEDHGVDVAQAMELTARVVLSNPVHIVNRKQNRRIV